MRAAFARGLVFVEEMVAPGLELLVSVDRTGFVPVLVVGLGGVHTELLDRVEILPLPVPRHRIDPRVADIAMRAAGARRGADRAEPGDRDRATARWRSMRCVTRS